MEVATALAFAGLYWWDIVVTGGYHPDYGVFVVHCYLVASLIAASLIDLDHQIIPDEITWTLVGSDVNILNERGIAAVNLGAALTHAHTSRESLRVHDLVAIARHAEAIVLEAARP